MISHPPGYRQLLALHQMRSTKTLNAALQAVRQGVIPAEGIAFLMNSLGPLGEAPEDFAAFDRLLSRPDLDLKTARFLMGMFLHSVHHPDTETALFAAESLNALEVRYNKAAFEARRRFLETPGQAEPLRGLLRAEYRLLVLNRDRLSLRRHHAATLVRLVSTHRTWFRLRLSDTLILLAAHRALGRDAKALRLLEACRRQGAEHLRLDLIRADLAFRAGRAAKAAEVVRSLDSTRADPRVRSLVRFWASSEAVR